MKGNVIKNKYVIKNMLKTTSAARYFECSDKNGQKYCLKVYQNMIPAEYTTCYSLLQQIDSPFIIKLFDYGTIRFNGKNTFYEILDERISKLKRFDECKFTEKECVDKIILHLSEVLEILKSKGLLLKQITGSISFDDTKFPVIADLSSVCTYDNEDDINERITKFLIPDGNPGYVAPECYSGIRFPASSYWSMGIFLAEIVLGHELYIDETGEKLPDNSIKKIVLEGTVYDHFIRQSFISYSIKYALKGLLIKRHDRRWTEKEIRDYFLNNLKVPVYEDKGRFFEYEFLEKILTTRKEMAQCFMENQDEAALLLKKKDFSFWFCSTFSNEHNIKIIDEILNDARTHTRRALFKLIYFLYPETAYVYVEKGSGLRKIIADSETFYDLLLSDPSFMAFLLKNENEGMGLYCFIQENIFGEKITKHIKKFALDNGSRTDSEICADLYVLLHDKKVCFFGNKTFERKEDFLNADDIYKSKFNWLLKQKNELLIAWLEIVFTKNIKAFFNETFENKSLSYALGACMYVSENKVGMYCLVSDFLQDKPIKIVGYDYSKDLYEKLRNNNRSIINHCEKILRKNMLYAFRRNGKWQILDGISGQCLCSKGFDDVEVIPDGFALYNSGRRNVNLFVTDYRNVLIQKALYKNRCVTIFEGGAKIAEIDYAVNEKNRKNSLFPIAGYSKLLHSFVIFDASSRQLKPACLDKDDLVKVMSLIPIEDVLDEVRFFDGRDRNHMISDFFNLYFPVHRNYCQMLLGEVTSPEGLSDEASLFYELARNINKISVAKLIEILNEKIQKLIQTPKENTYLIINDVGNAVYQFGDKVAAEQMFRIGASLETSYCINLFSLMYFYFNESDFIKAQAVCNEIRSRNSKMKDAEKTDLEIVEKRCREELKL